MGILWESASVLADLPGHERVVATADAAEELGCRGGTPTGFPRPDSNCRGVSPVDYPKRAELQPLVGLS